MKRLFTYLATLAVALGCSEAPTEEKPLYEAPSKEDVTITLTASSTDKGVNHSSKVAITENGDKWSATWEDGDQMAGWISGESSTSKFEMTKLISPEEAEFSAQVNSGDLRLIYPYAGYSVAGSSLTLDLSSQDVDLGSDGFSHLGDKAYMVNSKLINTKDTKTKSVDMQHVGAMLEIKLLPQNIEDGKEYTIIGATLGGGAEALGYTQIPAKQSINLKKSTSESSFYGTATAGAINLLCENSPTLKNDEEISMRCSIFPFEVEAGGVIYFSLTLKDGEGKTSTKSFNLENGEENNISFERGKHHCITKICDFGTSAVPPTPPVVDDPNSSIQTYNYPEVIVDNNNNLGYMKRSTFFEVEATTATQSKSVYVIAERNQYKMLEPGSKNSMMTNHNHFATFSFDGTITVKVKRIDGGSIASAQVYPKQKGYISSVVGNELHITLTERAYIYVEFADLKHKEPLFIFADPKETDAPKPTDANVELLDPSMSAATIKSKINTTSKSVIYFSEGVYNFDPAVTGMSYSGYQIPLKSNKEYYIPGGAVIVGSFYAESCNKNYMHGRGIVTACGKARLSSSDAIPYNLYMASDDEDGVIDGITFCSPCHFSVLSRGNIITRNCKMMGWWHQTDGWGGDHYSLLEDCFIKANDDNIKVYRNNMNVRNIVMYKQINGGGIQFGWGAYGCATNSTVDGLYIVNDDIKSSGDVSNTAVVNLRTNGGSTISGVTIKNVYIENDYQRLIGIDNVGGKFINFTLENIQVNGNMHCAHNYLVARDGKGTYSNILVKDLVINGTKVTSDTQAAWNLKQGYSNSDKKITKYVNLTTVKYE